MRWGIRAVLFLALTAVIAWPRARRPNVLLVTIDTLRADRLSAYGYGRATSPNLDRLAREGVLFEQCSSTANSTNPSHTSILTGTNITTHGVADTPGTFTRTDLPTLAERFRDAGYETAAVVSVRHLNGHISGFAAGFHDYFDVAEEETERQAADSVSLARAWVAARVERPFFLWLHLFDPHALYDPPAPYDQSFVSRRSPRIDVVLRRISAAEFFDTQPDLSDGERARLSDQFELPFLDSVVFNGIGLTDSEVDYLDAMYDGEVAYTDASLADLLRELDARGVTDDTLVVVTADHGEALGEHEVYCNHRTLYDEVLHVPLIFRLPGKIPAGRRISQPVSGIDVAPTILHYAGLPRNGDLEGHSLKPAIENSSSLPDKPVFAELNRYYASAVREDRWKLIIPRRDVIEKWLPPGLQRDRILQRLPPRNALFDLVEDPGETRDLVESHPDLAQRLLALREAQATPVERETDDERIDADTRERLRALGYGD
jgi:arylsulfatase A-like enzyme